MKKLYLLFTLIILYNSQTYEDCSYFEMIKKQNCENLDNTTHYCRFSNDQCIAYYKYCSLYSTVKNFTDNNCLLNIPPNENEKCLIRAINGGYICGQEPKECKDYTIGDDCTSLYAGINKRCVLFKDKCEAHSNNCEGLTQIECELNIPNDNKKNVFGIIQILFVNLRKDIVKII